MSRYADSVDPSDFESVEELEDYLDSLADELRPNLSASFLMMLLSGRFVRLTFERLLNVFGVI